MPQAAILLFADSETREGMGRMANALTTVKEFKDAGDDAILIFDGADALDPAAGQERHKYNRLLEDVRDRIEGACVYCARAYGVKDAIEAAGIPLLDDYKGHPSIRDLMVQGRQSSSCDPPNSVPAGTPEERAGRPPYPELRSRHPSTAMGRTLGVIQESFADLHGARRPYV